MATFALLALLGTTIALPQWQSGQWGHYGGDDQAHDYPQKGEAYKRVISISVDGLHASDVEKWLAYAPDSTIASLLKTGYRYSNAYTSAPSDSFPGTCAFYTGSTSRTTGVWYDDIWDRSLYAPEDTQCKEAGAESELA